MIRWNEAVDMLPANRAGSVEMIGRAHGAYQTQRLIAWVEDLPPEASPDRKAFATTSDAWDCFLDAQVPDGAWDVVGAELRAVCPVAFHKSTLRAALDQVFEEAGIEDQLDLHMRAALARALVLSSPVPQPVAKALGEALKHLSYLLGDDVEMVVHPSVTEGDAGLTDGSRQGETYSNVRGAFGLQAAWRKCFASAFTGRAVGERIRRGLSPSASRLRVTVTSLGASDRLRSPSHSRRVY